MKLPLLSLLVCTLGQAAVPADYTGKPFEDEVIKTGAAKIPGLLQAAYYDLGGEGVAYHDTDATNNGSGVLNREALHQRAHASDYIQHFREKEGVDLSFAKDFADLNHPNAVSPLPNQLYIGWTEDGEWTRYTVDVQKAGRYVIRALYSHQPNTVTFDVNGVRSATCTLPRETGHWHTWDYGVIGSIEFKDTGLQVLTFHYGKGNNFAYFEFEPESK